METQVLRKVVSLEVVLDPGNDVVGEIEALASKLKRLRAKGYAIDQHPLFDLGPLVFTLSAPGRFKNPENASSNMLKEHYSLGFEPQALLSEIGPFIVGKMFWRLNQRGYRRYGDLVFARREDVVGASKWPVLMDRVDTALAREGLAIGMNVPDGVKRWYDHTVALIEERGK